MSSYKKLKIIQMRRKTSMKKLGRGLLLALGVSSMLTTTAFASEGSDVSKLEGPVENVVSVYEEEQAVPLNPFARASAISYGWSMDASAGWVSGITADATSTAFVTGNTGSPVNINTMNIKIVLTKTNGSTTESKAGNNVSKLTCNLYDANSSSTFKSVKSTHTFKNTGYSDATKYVTKSF